ncbi:hypothetical protein [Haliscomenobacter hydrossis]
MGYVFAGWSAPNFG